MNVRDGDGVGDDVVDDGEAWHARAGDGERVKFVGARCGIAEESLILAACKVVIEPEAALIIVVGSELRRFVNVGSDVGQRIKLRRFQSDWAQRLRGKL